MSNPLVLPLLWMTDDEAVIENSLRFRAANSAYMSRTVGSGNRRLFTFGGWFKRGALESAQSLFGAYSSGNNYCTFYFNSSNQLVIEGVQAAATWCDLRTTQVFRDPGAWFHLMVVMDTAQATAADRITVYYNGSEITSFGTATYPALNADCEINLSTTTHYIGRLGSATQYFDGLMARVEFVDGQALTPSSFGETSTATGQWLPKAYAGSYGTNGFRLTFADTTSTTTLGNDTSGNGNNWTLTNFSVTAGVTYDPSTDVPTNNYATWNFLDKNTSGTMQNANLRWGVGTGVGYTPGRATMAIPSTGKWYFEITHTANGGTPLIPFLGIATAAASLALDTPPASGEARCIDQANGNKVNGGSSTTYGAAGSAGNTYGIAIDMDAGTIKFSYNGNYANGSGSWNQTYDTGASAFTDLVSSGKTWYPYVYLIQSWADINFGQRTFAYTPPTGFSALATGNLPTPSIKKPSVQFNPVLYTGTGSSLNVTGVGFQPDLVWIKSRSAATDHALYDAVRGVQNQLESNNTGAETTEMTGLTAFGLDGFTVGALAQVNTNTASYVAWNWKEGATPGFDIVTYTGDNTARTISHNLGAVPHMYIVKWRTGGTSQNWMVYHRNTSATPQGDFLTLNTVNGVSTSATVWNNTAPTSSVFSLGAYDDVNRNSATFVAYLWTEIAGFSRIGSYVGNSSSDGPFVWCGFRPAFVLTKRVDSAGNWYLWDDQRIIAANGDAGLLYPDLSNAESDYNAAGIDLLSNGFKLRNTDSSENASGGTYVFAAFARSPFKYANAR